MAGQPSLKWPAAGSIPAWGTRRDIAAWPAGHVVQAIMTSRCSRAGGSWSADGQGSGSLSA
jgi:hypothetical protein